MPLSIVVEVLVEAVSNLFVETTVAAGSWVVLTRRDRTAMRRLSDPQLVAFFSGALLVLLADGSFSKTEKDALHTEIKRLPRAKERWALIEQAQQRAADVLAQGEEGALIAEVVAALPNKASRQALINMLFGLHSLDKDGVVAKSTLLEIFCDESGLSPTRNKPQALG